jgi:hypothetical protein
MGTLESLKKEMTSRYVGNFMNDIGEGDCFLNDMSRKIIQAYKDEAGQAWLGRINLYGKTYRLTEFIGQMVYNFEYCYVLPIHDDQIEQMVQDREKAEYTGTKEDAERLTRIFERIEELGGTLLHWS